jgi:hypothetical protein
MVTGVTYPTSTSTDPLRLFRPEPEPEREVEREPLATEASNPIEDTFQLGGAALSTVFPQFQAVQQATGLDLNPLNIAARFVGGEEGGRDLGALNPEPQTKAERRYDHYANIIRENGGEINKDGATVLGIRNVDGASTEYGDRFVVLTPDKKVKTFTGGTHPGQSSSSDAPDVSGDGAGDVGILRPGSYLANANGDHSGAPSYHVVSMEGSDAVPGFRDVDHDGNYSSAERRASRERGDTVSEILFHVGGSTGPSSIGCQNLPPETMSAFIDAVGGPTANFNYTLVDRA